MSWELHESKVGTLFVTSYNPIYIHLKDFICQIASKTGQGKRFECHENSWDCVASGSYSLFSIFPPPGCPFLLTFLTEAKKLLLNLNTSIRSEMFFWQPGSILSHYLTHVLLTELIFAWSVYSWEINLSPSDC